MTQRKYRTDDLYNHIPITEDLVTDMTYLKDEGRISKAMNSQPKYIGFDLEIVKELKEGEDWQASRPLGISCIGLAYPRGDREYQTSVFYAGIPGEPEGRAMNKEELAHAIERLTRDAAQGYTPLTWNGLNFDFQVLAEESGQAEACSWLALHSVDMMFQFLMVKGFPLGLNTVAHSLGLTGKTEGMSGALAPIMWAGDASRLPPDSPFKDFTPRQLREKVLEYVQQDALTTLEVAEAVEAERGITWQARSGRWNSFLLKEQRWLSVIECLDLPDPDQSWMTNPLHPRDFINWIPADWIPSRAPLE